MIGSRLDVNPSPKTSLDIQETKMTDSASDCSPNELFKRMVLNDAKQNNRLKSKLHGLDLSNGKSGSSEYSKGPTKMRFYVCTLGLMALAMSQMCRMTINVTLPSMIVQSERSDERGGASVSADGSCPWPEEDQTLITPAPAVTARPGSKNKPLTSAPSTFNPVPLYPTSAPIFATSSDDENLVELPDVEMIMDKEDQSVTSTTMGPTEQPKNLTLHQKPGKSEERFAWDTKQQGMILGAFYSSYFVFMILGGRISEVYGAKYVILLSVAGSAIINLSTPWMARTSFLMLVGSRVIMGSIQSGVFPALYALIAKWLTMSEASIFAPLIKMNLRVGMVLATFIPGIMPSWQYTFYVTGFLSASWSIAWILVATSDPADNKWVSPGELAHINRKKRKPKQEDEMIEMSEKKVAETIAKKAAPSLKTPWLKILTAPPVIALIVVKLTFNYGLDFFGILLPSYLTKVHHVNGAQLSAITSPMFAIQVCLIVFVGWLAKVSVQRRPLGMTKTSIRKVFQGISSLGLALMYFLLAFNGCNLVYVAILLQMGSFLSMFTAGGETMLPYDLSDQYPATIMSIANSIANMSGVTTTALSTLILSGQDASYDRWNILILLIAGANLVGGLTFMILVKAEHIDFDSKSEKKSKVADVESASPSAPALEMRDGLKEVQLEEAAEPEEPQSRNEATSEPTN